MKIAMRWRLVRVIATTLVGGTCLLGTSNRVHPLIARLQAQQSGVSMPGPIIVDPPGPYVGNTHIPARTYLAAPHAVLSTFSVTYVGFTAQAQAAFQAAVDVWASLIQSSVPIRVTAYWTPLGPGVLGQAGAYSIWRDFPGAPQGGTWYPVALANSFAGMDLDSANPNIIAYFSSNFTWYYGTDGNAGPNFDLMTVVLHELGHGLGFFGSMDGGQAPGYGSWGYGTGFPIAYDRFAINGASQSLLNTTLFPNPSYALGAQLVSNNLNFAGIKTAAANSGYPARLYAPNPWLSGSSYSHLDESTFPAGNANSLMTPQLGPGEAIHDPGPIARGMLADIGWTVVTPAPRRTLGDFDGDGKTDMAVYRPSDGNWYLLKSSTNNSFWTIMQWGLSTDIPVPGDYDGDGKTDMAVYRPSDGNWYLLKSSTNNSSWTIMQWGLSTDIPVPGDYDGDGRTDMAVYRPSDGNWYLLKSSTNNSSWTIMQWGLSADVPVQADYDGDGKTDIAVYRPSDGNWFLLKSSTNNSSWLVTQWGIAGDVPAVPH